MQEESKATQADSQMVRKEEFDLSVPPGNSLVGFKQPFTFQQVNEINCTLVIPTAINF